MEHMAGLISINRDKNAVEQSQIICGKMIQFLDGLDNQNILEQYPSVHHITVYREQLYIQHDLPDPYKEEKLNGTKKAFALYSRVVGKLDSLPDFESRMLECCLRVFTGNIFDLGSVAVSKKHHHKNLRYSDLMKRVRTRKWFIDDLHEWLDSLQQKDTGPNFGREGTHRNNSSE